MPENFTNLPGQLILEQLQSLHQASAPNTLLQASAPSLCPKLRLGSVFKIPKPEVQLQAHEACYSSGFTISLLSTLSPASQFVRVKKISSMQSKFEIHPNRCVTTSQTLLLPFHTFTYSFIHIHSFIQSDVI